MTCVVSEKTGHRCRRGSGASSVARPEETSAVSAGSEKPRPRVEEDRSARKLEFADNCTSHKIVRINKITGGFAGVRSTDPRVILISTFRIKTVDVYHDMKFCYF